MGKEIKHKLKRFINELKGIRGRHTELVSVYVPAGYDMNKIINHLAQEQGTASNIKDKNTRKNVIDSLEKMIRHLRLYKQTPENGLAAFAGNISAQEGKTDLKVWSIEPPQPLTMRLYRCDQTFVLDELEKMLESKSVFGLIVIDKRDAAIGLLKGTAIIVLREFTSNVPGKTTKGGQCLNKNTAVQICDGDIEKIGNLHNPYIIKSISFNKGDLVDSNIINKWDTNKFSYKIITKCPRLEIESSKDHIFFVRSNRILEKSASELKIGDYLLMPEKINIKGKLQNLNFNHIKFLNKGFAQFLGYYLGDGNSDTNRIVFSEGYKHLAYYYKNLFDKLFKLDTKIRFRKNKNYYELRIYNKDLFDFIKNEFPELKKALNSEIPKKILRSPNKILASFFKGLFDAEGYVTKDELSIGMNNKYLIQQLQMLLLRFSIISSFCEYDNRKNKYSKNYRYTLRITDSDSLNNFKKMIGFNDSKKINKLNTLVSIRTKRNNNRQILETGKNIRKIIENNGLNRTYFSRVSNFFFNDREMSKNTFRHSILSEIKDNKELYLKLKQFLDYNLIPVKIKSIQISENKVPMSDISVKNKNFIANCVIVHNSQQRYARIREIAAHEFYQRVAEVANIEFSQIKELKGILVGGPGMTKETFVEGSYLHTELKNKVIGIRDLSYTGEFGLNELVEKSADVLSQEEVTKEKEIVQEFFTMVAKNEEKIAYGKEEVKHALEMGAVNKLLISEEFDEIDSFEELADNSGANVFIISTETREGVQLRDIGGIAAILRFAI